MCSVVWGAICSSPNALSSADFPSVPGTICPSLFRKQMPINVSYHLFPHPFTTPGCFPLLLLSCVPTLALFNVNRVQRCTYWLSFWSAMSVFFVFFHELNRDAVWSLCQLVRFFLLCLCLFSIAIIQPRRSFYCLEYVDYFFNIARVIVTDQSWTFYIARVERWTTKVFTLRKLLGNLK